MGRFPLPVYEPGSLHPPKFQGNCLCHIVNQCRYEYPPLFGLGRFDLHPFGFHRCLRPHNDYTLCSLEFLLNNLAESFPWRNIPIPPYRPTLLWKSFREDLCSRSIYAGIANKDIGHVRLLGVITRVSF